MSIFKTNDSTVISLSDYSTRGEKVLIVKNYPGQSENDFVKITLNHNSTKHITIKALTNAIINSPHSFDTEYDELVLNKFASVELKNIADVWYILSSDGMKNS
jgi:hypothetical protein